MSESPLNWDNIDAVLRDVMLNDQRDEALLVNIDLTDKATAIESLAKHGVVVIDTAMQSVALVTERLEKHRDDIARMIADIPKEFFKSSGGGYSMLQLPFRNDGTQWGEQWQADILYALAAGLGKAKFSLPRDLWASLPGGMPYITFEDQ